MHSLENQSQKTLIATGLAKGPNDSKYPNLWRGLVSCYAPMVGPQGVTTLFDFSPSKKHGADQNFSASDWVIAGEKGLWAYDFNGSNNYVNIPNHHDLSLSTEGFTVACLCRLDLIGADRKFVSKWNDGSSSFQFDFQVNSSAKLFFEIRQSNNSGKSVTSSETIVVNKDYVFVGVANKRSAPPQIWINGKKDATTGDPGWDGTLKSVNMEMNIGRKAAGGDYFSGKIFWVLVWDRVLAPQEISSLSLGAFPLTPRAKVLGKAPAGGSPTVTPSALGLTASVVAPTKKIDKSITAQSLTLGLHAPTVVIKQSPTALGLTASLTATEKKVTLPPAAQSLTATLNAPTIKVDRTVTPSALGLTATLHAPIVNTGNNVTIQVSAFALTATLNAVGKQAVKSPSALGLTATVNAPSPVVKVTPNALNMSAALNAPTKKVSQVVTVLPITAQVASPALLVKKSITVLPITATVYPAVFDPELTAKISKIEHSNFLDLSIEHSNFVKTNIEA